MLPAHCTSHTHETTTRAQRWQPHRRRRRRRRLLDVTLNHASSAMNNGGESLKKQAIDKAKSIASGAMPGSNSNGKKRRKQDLKPIVSIAQRPAQARDNCLTRVLCYRLPRSNSSSSRRETRTGTYLHDRDTQHRTSPSTTAAAARLHSARVRCTWSA